MWTSLKQEFEVEHGNIEVLKKACESIGADEASDICSKAMRLMESAYDNLSQQGKLQEILDSDQSESMREVIGKTTKLDPTQE